MDEARLEDIEKRVCAAINSAVQIAHSAGWGDARRWTSVIKRELTTLGQQMGCDVRGAEPQVHPEQWDIGWLWDMTWIESVGDHGLAELVLALECEWYYNWEEILWDFQKLVVSRALIKCMIFNTPKDDSDQQFANLIREIDLYRGGQKGDRYLLFCWLNGAAQKRLVFRRYEIS